MLPDIEGSWDVSREKGCHLEESMVVVLTPQVVVLAPLVVPAAAVATVVAILSGEVAASEETPFFGVTSWV